MVKVFVKKDESLEQALRRFNREVMREGIIDEVKKRTYYERPSQARKREKELKRRGKMNEPMFAPEVRPEARDSRNKE